MAVAGGVWGVGGGGVYGGEGIWRFGAAGCGEWGWAGKAMGVLGGVWVGWEDYGGVG